MRDQLDEEMSVEAEVGELLEAEAQASLGTIIEMMGKRWSGEGG